MSVAGGVHAEADGQQGEQWKASLSDYEDAGYGSPVTDWEQMFWEAGYKRGATVCTNWLISRPITDEQVEAVAVYFGCDLSDARAALEAATAA